MVKTSLSTALFILIKLFITSEIETQPLDEEGKTNQHKITNNTQGWPVDKGFDWEVQHVEAACTAKTSLATFEAYSASGKVLVK